MMETIKSAHPEMEGDGHIRTKKGVVQLYCANGLTGMVLAVTHNAARTFRQRFTDTSIANICSVSSETQTGRYLETRSHGATGLWMTDGCSLRGLAGVDQ